MVFNSYSNYVLSFSFNVMMYYTDVHHLASEYSKALCHDSRMNLPVQTIAIGIIYSVL